jgi:hypothetical protein
MQAELPLSFDPLSRVCCAPARVLNRLAISYRQIGWLCVVTHVAEPSTALLS